MPRLAAGTELLGEYQGSGFQEPKYLLSRADGQVIQLSHLLYRVAESLDGQRNYEQLSDDLSEQLDRVITAEQVSFLVEQKLRRGGVVADVPEGGSAGAGVLHGVQAGAAVPPALARPDPLLALKYRVGVIPPRVVWIIAGLFRPLFWLPVWVAALAGFIGLDVWIVLSGGTSQIEASAQVLISSPGQSLLVLAVMLVAGGFHECGHVTACRYGGARPGGMGVGLYLVWPAFYSTVTDSYRLGRGGRLRTDLGGVYFNVVFIAGMSAAYLGTGSAWLLIAILVLHFETVWQFLPSVRLDGYYILSDLIGVPDLFSRMGPVLRSLVPGRPIHPRVQELKPRVRWVITIWVLLVIPCLLYFLVVFLISAPSVLPGVWSSLSQLGQDLSKAVRAGDLLVIALDLVQAVLLLLPWLGVALITVNVSRRLYYAVRARWGRPRSRVDIEDSPQVDAVADGDLKPGYAARRLAKAPALTVWLWALSIAAVAAAMMLGLSEGGWAARLALGAGLSAAGVASAVAAARWRRDVSVVLEELSERNQAFQLHVARELAALREVENELLIRWTTPRLPSPPVPGSATPAQTTIDAPTSRLPGIHLPPRPRQDWPVNQNHPRCQPGQVPTEHFRGPSEVQRAGSTNPPPAPSLHAATAPYRPSPSPRPRPSPWPRSSPRPQPWAGPEPRLVPHEPRPMINRYPLPTDVGTLQPGDERSSGHPAIEWPTLGIPAAIVNQHDENQADRPARHRYGTPANGSSFSTNPAPGTP